MGMSNVREIHLMGEGIKADRANLPAQLNDLIQEHDARSVPLLPGEPYFHPVNDPQFAEGTHLLISVHPDGNDATCRRFVVDGTSPFDGDVEGAESSRRPMVLSEGGPVYFLSPRGTLERIVYRRS